MEIFLHFIALGASLVALILSLGIVWQSEKGLDLTFRFLSLGISVFFIAEFYQVLLYWELVPDSPFLDAFYALVGILLLISTWEMNRTIVKIWKKK